jgi:ribosomal protein S27AE
MLSSTVRAVVGLIGVASAISGLISESLIVPLNTVGVVGGIVSVLMIAVGVGLWRAGAQTADDRRDIYRVLLWVFAVASAIGWLLFLFGRPLEGSEHELSILTFMGTLYLLIAVWLSVAVGKLREPNKKNCPDCANSVLAAARKCQHCGYRFDTAAPSTDASPPA